MADLGIPSGNMVNFQPPTYNPFAGPGILSNPMMNLAMAMYLPQMVGQNNFLPSMVPSQHLFDQFTAAKYQNARMQGLPGVQAIDQQALTSRILGIRGMMTDAPATAMNVEQASNMAGIINHPMAKMFLGQMMGPENMEDLFYGRRGSAENLYQSVAKTGFFQADPVSGAERMSADSLSGVTREMYAQMYGPKADLSQMNGISAGRAGVMYEDLFRRGILQHASPDGKLSGMLGGMSAADRVKAVAGNLPTDEDTMDRLSREYAHQGLLRSKDKLVDGKTYAELTPQQQKEQVEQSLPAARVNLERDFQDIKDYNAGTGKKSVGEIEQMEGFGLAARSIDAQKATSTLKQYSGAIAAVREIFGDNGNPNAPMQQLITALEAMTQNQIGRMDPKKIEQHVREMQLAARSGGVGLQAQLAISSQAGAYGDQLGLDRSFAMGATLTAMQRGDAMRQVGALNRGFGGMDAEKAMLSTAYLEQSAAASPMGNMIGVAVRTVRSDPKRHYNDDGTARTPVGALVKAIEAGKDTYTDPTTGKEVDVKSGMATGKSGFIRDIITQTEDKALVDEQTLDFQGNQEFSSQIKNLGVYMQRADVTGDVGAIYRTSIESGVFGKDKGKDLTPEQMRTMSLAAGEALIDETHSGVKPEERARRMEERIRSEVIAAEEKSLEATIADPAMRRQEAERRADAQMASSYGSTPEERRLSMDKMIAIGDRKLAAMGTTAGLTKYNLKDILSGDVQEKQAQIAGAHKRRAELMGDFGDTQSTVLQRFSDLLGGIGSGDKATREGAIQAMLGIIPKERMEDAMKPGVGAVFSLAAEEYKRGLVTNDQDLIELKRKAQSGTDEEKAAAMEQLRTFAGDKGKGVTDVDKLFQAAVETSANKKVAGGEVNIGRSGDMVRGIHEGGAGGVRRSASALAQSLLGPNADKSSIDSLVSALETGDSDKLATLLPDMAPEKLQQVQDASKFYAHSLASGRGIGEHDAYAISRARMTTVDELAKDDVVKTAMERTPEGRRMLARAKADRQTGVYEFEGKKYNITDELGGATQADSEKFWKDAEAAAGEDQAAKDRIREAREGQRANQVAAATSDAGGPAAAAGGIAQGGISSASITIERLEQLTIQNATGLKLSADSASGDASSSPDSTPSPARVGAEVNGKKAAMQAAAVEAFNAALNNVGKVAHAVNAPLQDLLSGAYKHLGLTPDVEGKADAAVAQIKNAAGKVVPQAPDTKQIDNAVQKSFDQLTPSQQAEVEFLQAEQARAEARATLKDPNATPEQKAAAEKVIREQNEDRNRHQEREQIVGMRMAEEKGEDTSGDFPVDVKTETGAESQVTVNGRQLTADEREKFFSQAHGYGEDGSAGVSPAVLAHLELLKKQKAQKATSEDTAAQQQQDGDAVVRANQIAQQTEQSIEQTDKTRKPRRPFDDDDDTAEQKQRDAQQQQSEVANRGQQAQKQAESKQEQTDKKAADKKEDMAQAVPTIEEHKQIKAQLELAEVAKQVQTAEAQRGTIYAANYGMQAGGASGGGDQEITGVLQLRGLSEVFLAARGKQMDQPPENGPPIDMAEATRAYVGTGGAVA